MNLSVGTIGHSFHEFHEFMTPGGMNLSVGTIGHSFHEFHEIHEFMTPRGIDQSVDISTIVNKTFSYLSSPKTLSSIPAASLNTSMSIPAASTYKDPKIVWQSVMFHNRWGRVDLTTLPT